MEGRLQHLVGDPVGAQTFPVLHRLYRNNENNNNNNDISNNNNDSFLHHVNSLGGGV